MDRKQSIGIILEEIDQVYTIPTYHEERVKQAIGKALSSIHKNEVPPAKVVGDPLISIKQLSDSELLEQLELVRFELDSVEYGTGDYYHALSEVHVAEKEQLRRSQHYNIGR